MALHIKRAYDEAAKEDGYRVLVDRIWPRGVSKDDAKIDLWLKEIAPSTELRKWFDHDPDKWDEFEEKFRDEVHANNDAWKKLRDLYDEHADLTLVYAAKDEEHNNAVVLRQLLYKK